MKKRIKGTAYLAVPLTIEFTVDTHISEKELQHKLKDKLKVEASYALGGNNFLDADIKDVAYEEIT